MTLANASKSATCPNCGRGVPVDPGFSPWCDACNWNIEPLAPPPPKTRFERIYLALGRRMGARLHTRLKTARSLRPGVTVAKVVAIAIALVVHALTAIFLVLGLLLVVLGWPGVAPVVVGLAVFALGWTLRPKVPRLTERTVSRAELPTLYRLVDRVSSEVGAPRVHAIALTGEANAAFGQYGWRRRPVLTLGLSLYAAMDRQELVAVLGHEVGHGANGDPLRSIVVGTAVHSLITWFEILHPDRIWEEERGLSGLIAIPGKLLLLWLAWIPYWTAYLLVYLVLHDSQRAEYLADAFGARASGTDAAVGAFEKVAIMKTLAEATATTTDRYWRNQSLMDEVTHRAETFPARQRERVRRAEAISGSRLDATHPPTSLRIDLLRTRPKEQARVVLAAGDADRIRAELAVFEKAIQKKLLDERTDCLYH